MKNSLQTIKNVKRIRVILLISLFISASSCNAFQATTKNTKTSQVAIADYLAAQKNPDLNDEEKIKVTIDAYFTVRYEAQKAVAPQDFSPLLEDNTLDWVMKEIDKQEIELYINCMFDTSYRSYKFDLDYSSLEIKEDTAEVVLMESNQLVQSAVSSEVSKLGGLSHRITLDRKNGVWVIYQDEYKDDYTELIASTTKEEIKKQIDKNYTANGKTSLDSPEAKSCQNIIH